MLDPPRGAWLTPWNQCSGQGQTEAKLWRCWTPAFPPCPSQGSQPGVPFGCIFVGPMHMFKLWNHCPTFQIETCPVKVQTCQFWSGKPRPARQHDAAGQWLLPHTWQGISPLTYTQWLPSGPSYFSLISNPLRAYEFITFRMKCCQVLSNKDLATFPK